MTELPAIQQHDSTLLHRIQHQTANQHLPSTLLFPISCWYCHSRSARKNQTHVRTDLPMHPDGSLRFYAVLPAYISFLDFHVCRMQDWLWMLWIESDRYHSAVQPDALRDAWQQRSYPYQRHLIHAQGRNNLYSQFFSESDVRIHATSQAALPWSCAAHLHLLPQQMTWEKVGAPRLRKCCHGYPCHHALPLHIPVLHRPECLLRSMINTQKRPVVSHHWQRRMLLYL